MDSEPLRIPLKINDLPIDREIILAKPTDQDSTFIVNSIPAFVYGVAFGDRIKINNFESGDFIVTARSGQLAIRIFIDGTLEKDEIRHLMENVTSLGGRFEIGINKEDKNKTSLLLVSVDISKGFSEIESLMKKFEKVGGHWEYGNVYDQVGEPMNWW